MSNFQRLGFTLLVAVAATGAAVRLELLAARSLWIDEVLSLEISSALPQEILAIAKRAEPHPPGYYFLLRGWRSWLGGDFVTARLLSFVFGVSVVVLTWILARHTHSDWVALVAATNVAIHPFHVFASNEIRMYSMLTALGLGATLALVKALDQPARVGRWTCYGLLAAGVAYTSYYGLLLLAGHAAVLLWRVKAFGVPWRGPLLAFGIGLGCYAPWLPFVVASVSSNPLPWRARPEWNYLLGIVLTQAFGGHILGTPGYHALGQLNVWWVALGAAFGGMLGKGMFGGQGGAKQDAVRLSWVVGIGLALLASLTAGKVAAYYYHLTFLQPYAAILLAEGARQWGASGRGRRGHIWMVALAGGVLVVTAAAAWATQLGSGQTYRFDKVGGWLEKRRNSGDVTLYFVDSGRKVLRYYTRQTGLEIGIHLSPLRWRLEDVRPALKEALNLVRPEHGRLWLVLTGPFPPGSVEELLRLLAEKGYRETEEGIAYPGVQARLFVRR